MKRTEIRRILRSRRGAQAELARRAGVSDSQVSHWLKGRNKSDSNVAPHAELYARELLEKEKAAANVAA